MPNDDQTASPSRLERMAQGLYHDLGPHLQGLAWPEFRRLVVMCLRQALARPAPAESDPPPPPPS